MVHLTNFLKRQQDTLIPTPRYQLSAELSYTYEGIATSSRQLLSYFGNWLENCLLFSGSDFYRYNPKAVQQSGIKDFSPSPRLQFYDKHFCLYPKSLQTFYQCLIILRGPTLHLPLEVERTKISSSGIIIIGITSCESQSISTIKFNKHSYLH